MKWISVEDETKKPRMFEDCLIKTDCEKCPILRATFSGKMFCFPVIIQCDHHYETDQKFGILAKADENELVSYQQRITHWIPYTDPYLMSLSGRPKEPSTLSLSGEEELHG